MKMNARELIDAIVRENGFVRESSLASMPQDVRREVEEALLAKDKKIGASVLTLAKNLYTSSARFVLELLQNADDNQYGKARQEGEKPYISFSLFKDKLIVDCNEDGFTESNLRAICNIGSSSKTTSQSYIGEKGIGFKSVFMAAWKVHIQSGGLSFCFIHRKGDSGMGMVKPVWHEPIDMESRGTRMTLYLHQDGDITRQRAEIKQQLLDLHPTLLLFLRNIGELKVILHDDQGQHSKSTSIVKTEYGQANQVGLKTSVKEGSAQDFSTHGTQLYHVAKHMATNLSKSENRTLTAKEENERSYARSEIVLAFPMSKDSVPIIEPQKVFAFLPMRQAGFNFLIQADFVTQANREDVVTSSPRNRDLIKAIATAFTNAITRFCDHETLQYTWMRYVPLKDSHHWDPFWAALVDDIKQRLQSQPILRPRQGGNLRRIGDMRGRYNNQNDEEGAPLFRDLDSRWYLSDGYNSGDIVTLRSLGLRLMFMDEALQLVRKDLLLPDSRVKSCVTAENWQSRAHRLLMICFTENWTDRIRELRSLNLLPTTDGSWIRSLDGPVYYEDIDGIAIPDSLGLRFLDSRVKSNKDRTQLCQSLGVKTADIRHIRTLVINRARESQSINQSLSYATFLYLTHDSRDKVKEILSFPLFTQGNILKWTTNCNIYLQNNTIYGPCDLLGHDGAEATGSYFFHADYMKDPPSRRASGQSPTWPDWVHTFLGVKRYIPLFSANCLSKETQFIADHRMNKFLGFLKSSWSREQKTASSEMLNLLKDIAVPDLNEDLISISESYLPVPELLEACQRFLPLEDFPFLSLPQAGNAKGNEILTSWSFLTEHLGVAYKKDLDFYLEILSRSEYAFRSDLDTKAMTTSVINLYHAIEGCCLENHDEGKKKVSDYATASHSTWVPPGGFSDLEGEWKMAKDCRWDGLEGLSKVATLKPLYERICAGSDERLDLLQRFFKDYFQIVDVSWDDILKELNWLRENSSVSGPRAQELYRSLADAYQVDPAIGSTLRMIFEENSLLYAGQHAGWRTPSTCLWSSATDIDGKVSINALYRDLEDFFVEGLGVQTLNLQLIYKAILDESTKGLTVDRAKELLLKLNSLLASTAEELPSPDKLMKSKVFPVRATDGSVSLYSADGEFFLIDRQETFQAFEHSVEFLDFSLQQICSLKPLITWARLGSRYLSACIEEISRVDGGRERPISQTRHDLKKKAYALLRISAMIGSPRYLSDAHSLYNALRNAITVETSGISSILRLEQNGDTYEHLLSTSELHFDPSETPLKVYVPNEVGLRDTCYGYNLPRSFVAWLMTDIEGNKPNQIDDSAVLVMTSVLTCGLAGIATLLSKIGAPHIDIEEIQETRPTEEEVPSRDLNYLTPVSRPVPDPVSTRTISSTASTSNSGGFESPELDLIPQITPLTDPGDYLLERPRTPSRLPRQPLTRLDGLHLSQWREFLVNVTNIARHTGFPENASSSILSRFSRLSLQDFVSVAMPYYANTWEHRIKVGAAGELYVFEVLMSLAQHLPNFGRNNWQSRIRGHVTAHPEYMNLVSYTERETSDIVYDDVQGAFTNLLIQKGYLSAVHWTGRKPKYFIEVKSTEDSCDFPFFVSQGQYERILRTTHGVSGSERQDEVYVIFRVYNLGKASTGLKIYVDPEQQKREGRLNFSAEKYAVTPRMSSLDTPI